jgi:hypothetical protein
MKKFLIFIFAAILLISCKTQQLYINVLEPAPVTLPPYIKTVGVINRSTPTDKTKTMDDVDKALSLEGVDLDKDGAMESIRGLSDELLNNTRFDEVKTLNDIDFRTSSMTDFPVSLSWDIVDRICTETKTDALFALEKFDTDSHLDVSAKKVDVKTPLGTIPGIETQADMRTLVKTGWRIYDPVSKSILDEYTYSETVVFTGRGINPLRALAALSGRKEAVNEVSNKAGRGYAMRIIPFRIKVWRDYYVKGTGNFETARRKAEVGKWDEAGLLWEKETNNSSTKIAGRAAYNMAIINEINGDLEAALKWAQKSYEDYNNKLALDYVRILENRQYKNEVLNIQGAR